MGHRYAVLGAGRQGIAAAYDLGKFGDADEILLVDIHSDAAEAGAKRVNGLLGGHPVKPKQGDVGNTSQLASLLEGVTGIVSAVHFPHNFELSKMAVEIGASICDLGGNTGMVRKQLELDPKAKAAGVSIVPDCGMGPGMNISLATYAISLVEMAREVYIWDGGLPQEPRAPWHYVSTFNIKGLSNEYYGHAHFLRNSQVTEVQCFDGYEELSFRPPIGRLEAFVTAGGLSTFPWNYEGKLERLENKTLRYPGHWAQFRAFAQLGLLEMEPVEVGGVKVIPREFFHALLEPKIMGPETRDVCVLRVKCVGVRRGRPAVVTVELIDYFDEETGFSAMERVTGWHASIMTILAVQGEIPRGAVPVESAVRGSVIVEEARRRGLNIEQQVVLSRKTKAAPW